MIKPKKTLEALPIYPTDEYAENWELKLDGNENVFGVSPKVSEKLKNTDFTTINRYPYYGELLDELAKYHRQDKEKILLTNGCDEAINAVLTTYLEQGDVILSYAPTFSMPKIYANALGAEFVEVKYAEQWKLDLRKLISKVSKKTKIIYITTPNSPTGDTVSEADIEILCEKFPQKAIVVDATYVNFAFENYNYFNLTNTYPNLIVIKSFSKDYALAGLRLGYIITDSANAINIRKVISPYSVNSIAVIAAIEALKDKKHLQTIREKLSASREALIEGLEKMGFCPYRSEGNFVLCDFGSKADFIYKKLLINKIKVKKMSGEIKNCFRITVPDMEGVKKFLNTLIPRDLLVFDLDGVIFDVRNSYRLAIEKTFEHFTGQKLKENEIQDAKNLGGLNCDWDLTDYLLKKYDFLIPKKQIIEVFQKYFFNPANEGTKGLIDNEKLLLDRYSVSKLAKNYDLAVFTGRPKDEAYYSLQKFDIFKYFNIIITKNDLKDDRQKPKPDGLELIKRMSCYKDIFYYGDTGDDMLCAKSANIKGIGVLPPQEKNDDYARHLINKGAYSVLNSITEILEAKNNERSNQKKSNQRN